MEVTIHDHHSIGGRFETDGSFRGTVWHSQSVQKGDAEDDAVTIASTPSAPSAEDVEALRRLVTDVMRRAPGHRAT